LDGTIRQHDIQTPENPIKFNVHRNNIHRLILVDYFGKLVVSLPADFSIAVSDMRGQKTIDKVSFQKQTFLSPSSKMASNDSNIILGGDSGDFFSYNIDQFSQKWFSFIQRVKGSRFHVSWFARYPTFGVIASGDQKVKINFWDIKQF
jgi:hypothetical protein